jgi:hypothetical protein
MFLLKVETSRSKGDSNLDAMEQSGIVDLLTKNPIEPSDKDNAPNDWREAAPAFFGAHLESQQLLLPEFDKVECMFDDLERIAGRSRMTSMESFTNRCGSNGDNIKEISGQICYVSALFDHSVFGRMASTSAATALSLEEDLVGVGSQVFPHSDAQVAPLSDVATYRPGSTVTLQHSWESGTWSTLDTLSDVEMTSYPRETEPNFLDILNEPLTPNLEGVDRQVIFDFGDEFGL